MCTAISDPRGDHYFGRTLDHDSSYGEEVVVTPRRFPLPSRHGETLTRHHAFVGMAAVVDGYPLYYDGVNEQGLCMAGLRFAPDARYETPASGAENVAVFELLPRVLGTCGTVAEARALLERIRLVDTPFREDLPAAPLHWLIADGQQAVTVEATAQGLTLYDNPARVLTNAPAFPTQPAGACVEEPFSSQSRFSRAAYARRTACFGDTERDCVSTVFHMLGTVARPRDGQGHHTLYTACMNARRGIYYYRTYLSHPVTAVSLHRGDPTGERLARYPLIRAELLRWQN